MSWLSGFAVGERSRFRRRCGVDNRRRVRAEHRVDAERRERCCHACRGRDVQQKPGCAQLPNRPLRRSRLAAGRVEGATNGGAGATSIGCRLPPHTPARTGRSTRPPALGAPILRSAAPARRTPWDRLTRTPPARRAIADSPAPGSTPAAWRAPGRHLGRTAHRQDPAPHEDGRMVRAESLRSEARCPRERCFYPEPADRSAAAPRHGMVPLDLHGRRHQPRQRHRDVGAQRHRNRRPRRPRGAGLRRLEASERHSPEGAIWDADESSRRHSPDAPVGAGTGAAACAAALADRDVCGYPATEDIQPRRGGDHTMSSGAGGLRSRFRTLEAAYFLHGSHSPTESPMCARRKA